MGSSYCLSYKWLISLHKLRCANCATKLLFFFQTTKLSGHELKKTAVKQKCLSSVYRLAVDAKSAHNLVFFNDNRDNRSKGDNGRKLWNWWAPQIIGNVRKLWNWWAPQIIGNVRKLWNWWAPQIIGNVRIMAGHLIALRVKRFISCLSPWRGWQLLPPFGQRPLVLKEGGVRLTV